eukprot:3626028-Prymnesium_polylepis.1
MICRHQPNAGKYRERIVLTERGQSVHAQSSRSSDEQTGEHSASARARQVGSAARCASEWRDFSAFFSLNLVKTH